MKKVNCSFRYACSATCSDCDVVWVKYTSYTTGKCKTPQE